ncbi:ABC transporter substrate-binding protein [Bradyrhizobium canariense]|uniref:NitT/TauT family transport system substrate-binding protein n=1 Tax=Bradyrhizobium canariense TaxID=255045 RepID=A0A1H1SMM8_9BRAD|nr:ABC transporter substrate-binding protein [Bradyrhizobium canariense]SDS48639.1 NitT/TauT family transport system substrate-binding protein [Bradyrhizobium canariense]
MKITTQALLAMCLLLAAGFARATAPETPKLSLAYIPISNFLTAYVAKDQGYFTAHGLDVTLIPINQGNTGVAGIVSKSVELSTPTPTTFLQAVDNGVDLVIVAATHTYPTPNKVGLLVSTTGDITAAKDLVGKKVGINGIGGMQFVLLQEWLIKHGVNPKSITFVEISFPQMADALQAKQVDAVTISEPFYQRVISSKIGRMLADLQADIPAGTLGTMYVSTGEWAKKNPGTIAALRASLEDATRFIKTNPETAKKSLITYAQMSEQLLQLVNVPSVTVAAAPSQMKFWIDLMDQQQLTTGTIDPQSIIAP